MLHEITSVKSTRNPDTTGWSQVYDYKPNNSKLSDLKGHLFALISTSYASQGLDTIVAGRKLLSKLHEGYFGNLDANVYRCLKDAVAKIVKDFLSWGEVEIAAVVFAGSSIYIVIAGEPSVYLKRKDSLYRILKGEKGKIASATGKIQSGDIIVAGSNSFYKTIALNKLSGLLIDGNPTAFSEKIVQIIRAQSEGGRIGVIVGFVNDKTGKNTAKTFFDIRKLKKDELKVKDDYVYESKSYLIEKFAGFFKSFRNKELYVKNEFSDDLRIKKSKRKTLFIGIIFLLLLIVSIAFGIYQKKISDFKSSYESEITSAEHEIQESKNLYLLNPQRSRELFDSARNRISKLTGRNIKDQRLDELIQKVKTGEEEILGQYSAEPKIFVDLNLFSEGFRVSGTSVSGDFIYILSANTKRIIKVSMTTKKTETTAGPSDVGGADSLASYSGRIFVLGNEGLYELDNGRIKIDEGSENNLIASFAGNIYLLDRSASKIFRYPAATSGFGKKSDWLSQNLEIDLRNAKAFIIDGSIWVLSGEKDLLKFASGNLANFKLTGIYPETEEITDIFTSDESDYLYLLESKKGRIVVTDKDGEYKAQYTADKIKDALKLSVSEKEKKAFLLTEDKIFAFDLRHLE